jgi:hypothetical protein
MIPVLVIATYALVGSGEPLESIPFPLSNVIALSPMSL